MLLLTAACAREQPPTWHQDVRPLLERHCDTCHRAGGLAPIDFTDQRTATANAQAMVAAVRAGLMPPWLAADGCADYLDNPRLSADEVNTLEGWAAAGAPAGDRKHPAAPGEPVGPGLSRVDYSLRSPAAYTPPEGQDTYRCFVLAWPASDSRYVTGFRARPGNDALVHHVIVFVIPPDQVASVEQLDAADPAPGYSCFGGPGSSGYPNWLGVWAPGGTERDFPTGTGVPVQPGSKLVLQVHYHPHTPDAGSDQTSVDVAVAASVERQAALVPMVDPGWFSTPRGMAIAPGDANAVFGVSLDPTLHAGWVTQGVLPADQPLDVYAAGVHMHQLGTSASLTLTRADGSRACLLDVPRWDFGWQRGYFFSAPKRVNPGDRLSLACRYDNSAAHQPVVDGVSPPPHEVNWGERTTDEMCLGVFYIAATAP